MFDFRISCKVQSRACDTMDLLNQAGQIISDNLVLTRRISVLTIVYQTLDVNTFGFAGPTFVDYTDPEDGVSRGYATALIKQLDPNFQLDSDDITFEVNSNRDASFWFPRANSEPIEPNQIDFLEFILHELHHGLGIISSWGLRLNHVEVGVIPYLDDYYDGEGQWTFGGYSENGFDKYLLSMDDNVQITTYTKALNDISGPPERHYKDEDDFFNVLMNVQEEQGKLYTKNMTRFSTTPRKLGFSLGDPGDVDEVILLETSYNPPVYEKSIQHLSYDDYYDTPDFLFISDQVPGVSLKDKIENNGNVPGQGVGPSLMLILETMGYESRLPPTTKNTKLTRRKLKCTSNQ